MSSFRQLSAGSNFKLFAEPTSITHTLRVKIDTTPKTAGKVKLTNVRAEFVETNPLTVTSGADSGTDLTSARVVFSGSTMSDATMVARWNSLKANVDAAIADGVLKGFLPNVTFIV